MCLTVSLGWDPAVAQILAGNPLIICAYPLSTRGQSLSGGELQRLAIARTLVRDPGVLVLDEVTNHLDADAYASFKALLRKLALGRIVLLVSHDEEIINLCDEKISCQIPENASYLRA